MLLSAQVAARSTCPRIACHITSTAPISKLSGLNIKNRHAKHYVTGIGEAARASQVGVGGIGAQIRAMLHSDVSSVRSRQ